MELVKDERGHGSVMHPLYSRVILGIVHRCIRQCTSVVASRWGDLQSVQDEIYGIYRGKCIRVQTFDASPTVVPRSDASPRDVAL